MKKILKEFIEVVSIEEALKIIGNKVESVGSYETIPLENSVGRILAEEILAEISLPKFDNSAMDGFAVKLCDAGKSLNVVHSVFAGDSKISFLKHGEAIKIMTGAPVPDGTEAVVPFENVQKEEDGKITLPKNLRLNQNIRFSGEDVKQGEKISTIGDKIDGGVVSLLTSQGITHVKVFRKIKVAIFSTGEEIVPHFFKAKPFQVYNSNSLTLLSLSQMVGGVEVSFIGNAKDSLDSIKESINSSRDFDLILTSGGVSVGDADFTKRAFEESGLVKFFEKIDIKPGKPTSFGKIGKSYVLLLPGNPLACNLNFELFGRTILQKLKGEREFFPNFIETKISEELKLKGGKETIIHGSFNGKKFTPSQKRGPGMVSALSGSNGFVVVGKLKKEFQKNEEVKFIPTAWNFFNKNLNHFITN